MKTYYFLVLLLVVSLLVFSSCAPAKPAEEAFEPAEPEIEEKDIVEIEEPEDTVQQEQEKEAEPEKEVQEIEQEQEVEAAPSAADLEVQNVIDKVQSTTQLKFMYHAPSALLRDVLVYLKGNMMHLHFTQLQVTSNDEFYTDVYIDKEKQIATVYCLNRDQCGHGYDIPADTDASQFDFMTPLDWGREITPDAKVTGSAQIFKRDANIIEFKKGTKQVKIYAYDYNKLPGRVDIDGKSYTFEIYATNVADSDVSR